MPKRAFKSARGKKSASRPVAGRKHFANSMEASGVILPPQRFKASTPTLTPAAAKNPAIQSSNHPAYPAPMPKLVDLRTQGEASISTERVTMSVRMRFNPLRGMTPDRLAQILDQFDMGYFRAAAILWDRLERRDYNLKSVVPKRKKAVARLGFEILTVDNIPDAQKALAEAQAADLTYFYNNLTATDALKPDQIGGLSLLVRQMRDADCKYYAVHELVWQPDAAGLTAQFVFCPLWWFEGTTGKLRYMDSEFQVYGRDMLPGEWLVTCGEGLMEACSVAWMFKHLALTDWLNFCERYGQPFIDAATSASPGSDDWDKLVDYVQNFGADGGGVRSQSANIALMETKNSGVDTFGKMVENMDRAMTILWRGGDLGTSSAKDQTGASLQGDETDILETDDAVATEETLATNISRYVISYKYGPDAPVLAYLKFKKQDKQNVELDLQIDQFLLDAGAPLGVKNTLERFSRPVPEAGEDLLTKPQPPALPGQPGKPQPDLDEAPELANSQLSTPQLSTDLGACLHEMILPLLKRLEAIAAVDDAGIQQHMIEKLLKDFPSIANAIQADDSLAKKLSPTLAGALVSGLKGKAEMANSNDNHLPPGTGGGQFASGNAAGGGAAVEKVKEVLSGKSDEAVYAKVAPDVATKIKAATGKDVSGYQHFIDHDALVHIDKQHGVGNEDQAGHKPITKDDIEKIPQIVASPDKVENGGISERGAQSVKYTKRFNGTTYYVEEVWAKDKLLAAKTMFKKDSQ